jgi:long-chain acyl-CoA synthetase
MSEASPSSVDELTKARPGSVEFWAERTPGKLALREGNRALSWAEWNDAADRIAEVLSSHALIAPGDRVAVCMHNRIEWFISQAAIAKLDAVLVPVSPRLTPAEVQYIVTDSGALALLFDAEDVESMARVWMDPASIVAVVLSVMRSERGDVLSFGHFAGRGKHVARYAVGAPQSIVYTSGTTGRPRGVITKETAPRERSEAVAAPKTVRTAEGTAFERNLLGAPLTHAAGQASARSTHILGGCVHVMPRFDAEEALRVIDREKITLSFLVPTMLSRIVNLPEQVRAKYDVSSIRMITTGASPCPQPVKEKVIQYFGAHCLYESYGSTEVGVIARMEPADHLRKPGACGTLLEGVTVRLVDDQGREVPAGADGEVLVRTPRMIERYLNEGTPKDLRDGFFAMGDIGRFDADGYLYIVDRKKDMIIAGGVNIYPAEIEDALRKHPAVIDVAAFGIPHPELGEQVKAAVELAEGATLTEAELLTFVASELAAYKRPRSIDFMRELPRNPAGKLLKAELRAPYWSGHEKRI